ncbi:MAG: UPF0149 family protein [Azoarcus sp.]|jgi:uncharacterized protein|nr:UPF0149 family protein [Azoarcus sp.]
MTCPDVSPLLLSDEDLVALEEILVSDAVPEDCMTLEMLDGFLAGVLLSPRLIAREDWLPSVWSAYGEADFEGGVAVQRAIQLVLAYYNEIASTLGREEEDGRWEPFCFAAEAGDDKLGIGDEWVDGFIQGLDLWPEDWREGLDGGMADAVQDVLQQIIAPWDSDEADVDVDAETRIGWLTAAGERVNDIFLRWRAIGLPAPLPVALDAPLSSVPEPGRNEPCPCGSSKKYKKCCGAGND